MSKTKSFSRPGLPLTPPVFHILLALSTRDRHGYDIMKQVQQDSRGKIKLGPGTLYSSIKRMLEAGLIIEAEERVEPDDERRKYYRLTDKGRETLLTEIERLSEALEVAKALFSQAASPKVG